MHVKVEGEDGGRVQVRAQGGGRAGRWGGEGVVRRINHN